MSALAGLGLDLQGYIADFDGGCVRTANLEGEVDALASGNRDSDVFGFGRGKGRRRGFDVVHADAQRRDS